MSSPQPSHLPLLPPPLNSVPLRERSSLRWRLTFLSATLLRSSIPLDHVPRRVQPSSLRSSCETSQRFFSLSTNYYLFFDFRNGVSTAKAGPYSQWRTRSLLTGGEKAEGHFAGELWHCARRLRSFTNPQLRLVYSLVYEFSLYLCFQGRCSINGR